jgi:hypothetical protein
LGNCFPIGRDFDFPAWFDRKAITAGSQLNKCQLFFHFFFLLYPILVYDTGKPPAPYRFTIAWLT